MSRSSRAQVQQSLQMLEQQKLQRQIPIQGLELGAVVGKGSFGTVFRARYKGQNVAVKVTTTPFSALQHTSCYQEFGTDVLPAQSPCRL